MGKAKKKGAAASGQDAAAQGKPLKQWHIEWVRTDDLIPYERNARMNDQTVPYLVNAIRRFGFRVPLVIDQRNIIVCGHTRLKAAQSIGLEKLPCVRADDLTDAELKAFRLADNKIQELSQWDFGLLVDEMKRLAEQFDGEMVDFGFAENGAEFDPDEMFDDENAREKKKKHYGFDCPNCGKHIVVEG